MTDLDGVVSLSERFNGVEAALMRIETKLDSKVEHSEFKTVVERVSLLEAGETPLGKFVLHQFETVQQQVNDLTLHGSTQAREANDELVTLKKDVEVLRFESQTGRALNVTKQNATLRVYRVWGTVLSFFTFLCIATNTYLVARGR